MVFPLALPMASISSMKIIQGALAFAWAKRSRTLEAPTPTNISTKSEPESEKKGTLASPATAFANRVLPVPGGPINKAPLGIFPPNSVYFVGFFRKSTISITSILASSSPATSLKVTVTFVSLSYKVALLLPILNICAPPGPPENLRMIMTHSKTIKPMGISQLKISRPQFCFFLKLMGMDSRPFSVVILSTFSWKSFGSGILNR